MSSGAIQAERASEEEGSNNVVCLPFSPGGPLFDAVLRVYAQAFARGPYYMEPRMNERNMRTRLGVNHASKAGLTTMAAMIGGDVVGMAYGYRLEAGDWWGDLVRKAVSPQTLRAWLADAFVVVEVAVAPVWQGHGIGPKLLTAMLDGRPERTAILSTRTDAPAHTLYRRLGFEVLTEMRFGESAWHFIMGRRLP